MKIWVGVTDKDWFDYLSAKAPDEVNFWQPSGRVAFRALSSGELYLFKLHAPLNYVVGGGFFVRHSALPASLAWQAFGEKNGVSTYGELLARVRRYRRSESVGDPVIGCNILAEPFFVPERAWIPIPKDWAPNIVRGKTYDTGDDAGASLWRQVQPHIMAANDVSDTYSQPAYGAEYLVRARLGQGAFRVLVTDAYGRRCAVTGERTLPALEAAHIRAHSEQGPNRVDNGLLLRSDIHRLFDVGYVTIDHEFRLLVSRRIKEEYENGREYYHYHGRNLANLPQDPDERPSREYIDWHNQRFVE